MMAEIEKSTDLTKVEGDPGDRAELQLEQYDVEVDLPSKLGGKVKISVRTRTGAMMVYSIAVLLLSASGALIAGVALAAGAPAWLTVTAGLIAPPAYLTVAHALFRKVK